MIPGKPILERRTRLTLAGVPEGIEARLIADLAADGTPVLHIARDDARMRAVADALAFFAPGIDVIQFPAWDCLPYDRVSPNPAITARRMEALARLAGHDVGDEPRVVLTTVAAAGQRVAPRDTVAGAAFTAKPGDTLDHEALSAKLLANGYGRVETVMEAGEFALRGGLIDIFPPGSPEPLRLDLFGDVIETIRRFDPVSQRTTGRAQAISLVPAGEIVLNEASISRFRTGYVGAFGAAMQDDPLYEAISLGRKYHGMEHWLALFHDRLETLFDYLPQATLTLDYQAEDAFGERRATIEDHYQARRDGLDASYGAPPYKPLPPDRLYLAPAEWEALLGRYRALSLTPHRLPETEQVIDLGGRPGRDFAPERAGDRVNVFDALRDHLVGLIRQDKRVVLACYGAGARTRLVGVLADHGIAPAAPTDDWPAVQALPAASVALALLRLEHGFETARLAVITEQDILGDRLVARPRRQARAENFITEISTLSQGDLVVHVDHGIGRFEGLRTIEVSGQPHECAFLSYAGGDRLFVPIENIDVLSRYGSDEAGVTLDRLGGAAWQSRKSRLKNRIRDLARQLIALAAERALDAAPRMTPPDGLYEEFCARFPHQETEDQDRAMEDVLDDLASGRPMDRLICGDVGFGKTEIALRAAFIATLAGYQVALIAPTTLLARQHHNTFRDRFAGLPVRIEQLSRMVSGPQAAATREGLADGQVDIVIGTHALLGKGVRFRRLGLLIIDEEQHFGVRHKEKLKRLKSNVHVLTLTATPIPRTLQLALSGVRGMSLIATPPVDRLAVRTFVLPFDPVVVREALLRELYRGGQSFYVCPRIADLPEAERFLREHIPEVKLTTAHGRLPASQLDAVMNAYYDGAYDVLLSTSIIESGLDIPTANTMIVHRADRFGLAQLYQMRGRIGRAKMRAYAYLTVPPQGRLTADAEKRLKVLQALDSLGAGFQLASHDLDIRGAGNLLGEEQSGHIREVGFELYQDMLEHAVAEARSGAGARADKEEVWAPTINLGTPVLIPEAYVGDLDLRMGLYRRIARLDSEAEIDAFTDELVDRFGPLPSEVETLLSIVAIKRLCRVAWVEKLDAGPKGAVLSFRDNAFPNPAGLVEFLSAQSGTARLGPDHRLIYSRDWPEIGDRLKGARRLLTRIADIAAYPSADQASGDDAVSAASSGSSPGSAAIRSKS